MRLRILLILGFVTELALAGAAAPAEPGCKLVQAEEWPVRIANNKLIVDGAINGEKVGVLVDTGASRTLIFRPAATRLGLDRRRSRSYPMLGVGGTTDVETAVIDELRIGDATRRGLRMMVVGEQDPGDGVAVLLGEDFLRRFDVEFDLAHGAVRLFVPTGCDGASLAYWTTGKANEVAIEPMNEAAPKIIVMVRIDGQPLRALLDSGAGASMLEKSAADRLGVTPTTPGVVLAGSSAGLGHQRVDLWIGTFRSVDIGGESIPDAKILFGDLWAGASYTPIGSHIATRMGGEQSMLLGADFLRAHRLLVAHSQQKIYFTYAAGPVFPQRGPAESGNAPAGPR